MKSRTKGAKLKFISIMAKHTENTCDTCMAARMKSATAGRPCATIVSTQLLSGAERQERTLCWSLRPGGTAPHNRNPQNR